MKQRIKQVANFLASLSVAGSLLRWALEAAVLGRTRACAAASQRAARWAGLWGEYRRRALLRRVLGRVGADAVVGYGSIFTKPTAEIGRGAYVGAYGLFGDVRIGDDAMIADRVCIPSGAAQHGIGRLDRPMREQPGELRTIHIGGDCWIGSGSVVMADVGDHAVVGAGSVVTRPVGDYQIVAGNPARVIGDRRHLAESEIPSEKSQAAA